MAVDGDDDQSGDWEPFQEEQPPDAEQGVEQEGQDDWQGAQPVAEDVVFLQAAHIPS